MNFPKIIAVDFDGCLFVNRYPEIGDPITKNINKLKKERKAGAKIILWTNRCGVYLQNALYACADYGIFFDAVNANLPEVIHTFGNDSRKIFANEYWDDRAVKMDDSEDEIPRELCYIKVRCIPKGLNDPKESDFRVYFAKYRDGSWIDENNHNIEIYYGVKVVSWLKYEFVDC